MQKTLHSFFSKDTQKKPKTTTTPKNSECLEETENINTTNSETVNTHPSNSNPAPPKTAKPPPFPTSASPNPCEPLSQNSPPSKRARISSAHVDPALYQPSLEAYRAAEDACWSEGEDVPYRALSRVFEEIESTKKRLKITEILRNFLHSVFLLAPKDLLPCVYLCVNRLAPQYEGVELGIGDMILMKSIAEATGRSLKSIREELETRGDLGMVAESSRSNQKTMFTPASLTVAHVYRTFRVISSFSGNSSMQKKVDKVKTLLVASKGSEARYIIRSLSGKLRIGLAEQSLLTSLGQAAAFFHFEAPTLAQIEAAVETVKTCFCQLPSYDVMVPVLLLPSGLELLPQRCALTPGIPLKPMLAHPTKGISEVLKRFEGMAFTCEFKYDGERAQIHYQSVADAGEEGDGGAIRVFSRNMEDNTSKYPDILARIPQVIDAQRVRSFILDCEAVAFDVEKKAILPFQVLSTRKRKDAEMDEIKVQVCLFAFDLLYLNGRSFVKEAFRERRNHLREFFSEIPGAFQFATFMDGTSLELIEDFLEVSIQSNCEGLMVKTIDAEATYEIAKRSHNWLKVKKDYLEGIGDTLDLLVIGAYYGKGKRTGVYGGFLLACYDECSEEYQSICKLGTGFSDADLAMHSAFFSADSGHVLASKKSYYCVDESLSPDVWFDSVQVWEVKAADLSLSPVHKAACGLVDPERGISLRFPRFLRVREDKSGEQATSAQQVAEMYRNQQLNSHQDSVLEEEDFY